MSGGRTLLLMERMCVYEGRKRKVMVVEEEDLLEPGESFCHWKQFVIQSRRTSVVLLTELRGQIGPCSVERVGVGEGYGSAIDAILFM